MANSKKKYLISVYDAADMKMHDFYLTEEELHKPFVYPKEEEPFEDFPRELKSFVPYEIFKDRHGIGANKINTVYCSKDQIKLFKKVYPFYYADDGRGMPIENIEFGMIYSDKQIQDINTCLQLAPIIEGNGVLDENGVEGLGLEKD